jgi:hypothetical protein
MWSAAHATSPVKSRGRTTRIPATGPDGCQSSNEDARSRSGHGSQKWLRCFRWTKVLESNSCPHGSTWRSRLVTWTFIGSRLQDTANNTGCVPAGVVSVDWRWRRFSSERPNTATTQSCSASPRRGRWPHACDHRLVESRAWRWGSKGNFEVGVGPTTRRSLRRTASVAGAGQIRFDTHGDRARLCRDRFRAFTGAG